MLRSRRSALLPPPVALESGSGSGGGVVLLDKRVRLRFCLHVLQADGRPDM